MLKITPFSIIFLHFVVFALLSWPSNILWPSSLYGEVIALTGNEKRYDHVAFAASLASFLVLSMLYWISPSRRHAFAFQRKKLRQGAGDKVWAASFVIGTLLCLIMFYRAGGTFPLLAAAELGSYEYRLYRTEIADTIGGKIVSILFYGVIPINAVSGLLSTSRWKPLLVALSIVLFAFCLMFSLARTTIVIPIFVVAASLFASRQFKVLALLRVSALVAAAVFGMFVYSTFRDNARWATVVESFSDRVIHGQWVGLPMYLEAFEHEKTGLVPLVNPLIKRVLGASDRETPGRWLMWFAYPDAAREGAAGNIPTLYIGEAYAVMGWGGVVIATIHIFTYIMITSWSFHWIQKTPLTCALYGLIVVKIASGVVNGYSAFLVASTSVLVIGVALWATILQAQRKCPRGERSASDAADKHLPQEVR